MTGRTVGEAIRAAAAELEAVSDTARLDAELLMAHALGRSRSDMLLQAMAEGEPAGFAALVRRRAASEPIAYITGMQEFYGRDFAVGPGVLIPRGDSETIVDAAFEFCPVPKRVLDLGTGSGALLLTVLAQRPGVSGLGIDASPVAVEVATQNAAALGLADRSDIRLRSWRADGWKDGLGTFDLVLCNPPYVEADAALDPGVVLFEPAQALFGGAEGLDDYRILLPQVADLLEKGGVAVFETGYAQAGAVTEIAKKAGFSATLRRDLAGRDRALVLTRD